MFILSFWNKKTRLGGLVYGEHYSLVNHTKKDVKMKRILNFLFTIMLMCFFVTAHASTDENLQYVVWPPSHEAGTFYPLQEMRKQNYIHDKGISPHLHQYRS